MFFIEIKFAIAQNPDINRTNHCYFGLRAGLDFSTGNPVPDTLGKLNVLEGSATISDTSGNLLFYTDGKMIWNAQHDTMMNGTGLGVFPTSTPHDGVVIIPKPSNSNIYYVFTVDAWEHSFQNGLRWHEVDMSLDNGLGAVISKNNILFAPTTEQLAATKHANGCDYWVTVHELNSANFRSYRITLNGIDTIPVISAAGTNNFFPQQIYSGCGGEELNFSPDGNIVGSYITYFYAHTGIPHDTLELFHFSKINGTLNLFCQIPVDSSGLDFAFSPNSQVLYMEAGYWVGALYQYDLSSGIDSLINNSKTIIHPAIPKGIASTWQLGKNGKLYTGRTTLPIYISDTLSVINYPNLLGIACDLQIKILPLKGRMQARFVNFVSSFLQNTSSSNCIAGINPIVESEDFDLSPNPAHDYILIRKRKTILNKEYPVRLIEMSGKKILESKIVKDEMRISVASVDNGIYILEINSDKLIFNKKVIINH